MSETETTVELSLDDEVRWQDDEASSRLRHRRASRWRLERLTVDERVARGRAARQDAPRSSHAAWSPATDRPDPVALLEAQARTRVPWLVPIRHGRMMVSPFTFFRGSALVMANDLASTPRSGVTVQLCGDAHLSNFGAVRQPRSDGCCSTSTTSTRRCPARGNGTSSVSRPASRSWVAIAASPRRIDATIVMAGVLEYQDRMRRAGRKWGVCRHGTSTSRPAYCSSWSAEKCDSSG